MKKIRRTPNFSEAKFSVKPKSGNNSIVVVAAALQDFRFTNSDFFYGRDERGKLLHFKKKRKNREMDREWKLLFGSEMKANFAKSNFLAR